MIKFWRIFFRGVNNFLQLNNVLIWISRSQKCEMKEGLDLL